MNGNQTFWKPILMMAVAASLVTGPAAQAFDHLEINLINPHLVEGVPAVTVNTEFSVNVRAVNADGSTDVAANFIHAQLQSPDVAAVLPGSQYLINGEFQFDGVSFLAAGQPVRLRVLDQDDSSVPAATVQVNAYNPVDHFQLSIPSGEKYVDQAVRVTITARDAAGATVPNFRDDVELEAQVGHFPTGPTMGVGGDDFILGVASVAVTFWGTDPVTRENLLTATNTVMYSGQVNPAAGSATVTPLLAGPLREVVLLLPGEALTPGVSPGKTGTPMIQTSGMQFGGISVFATDQHWNPVDPGLLPDLSWTSDDPSAPVVLPAAGPMGGNPESNLSATMIRAGTTRLTVLATGPVSASSRSDVIINPQGLDHFEFDLGVWNPADPQVATIPFNIRVFARDANDNLFPLNGAVGVRARIGTSDESADYVLTDNFVFTDGQMDALVQVTKRGFSARLIVDSGVVGESDPFQVNSGPCEKILVSFPGETWVNGLNDPDFSGNQGLPNRVTAGDVISQVTLRPVDRYNNLAPGARNVTLSCPSGWFSLPDHPGNMVTLNNPVDVRLILRSADQPQFLRALSSGLEPGNSSAVQVSPAPFDRLVVAAPGEILEPGIFDTVEDDGKLGSATVQDAGVPFTVRVYATDAFWNPITEVDPALPLSFSFSSSDEAAALPADPQTIGGNSGDFGVTLITLADPNHQTIRVDQVGGQPFAFTTVPMKAGVIDHFDMGINSRTNPTPADQLDPLPDIRAGSLLPNVTIVARDVFNNHVADYTADLTLFVSHGAGVLTPVSVDLGEGFGNGVYQGAWRGSIRITRTGNDVRLFARDNTYAHTDSSNTFDVFASAQDYSDLLVLLPGETPLPGIAPGKAGEPLPLTAGEPVVATVIATDPWWNQVPAQPRVHFTSDGFFQMVSPNDSTLEPDGLGSFDLFFKTAAVQTLSAADLVNPSVQDRSRVLVEPSSFTRLMLLLPGEAAQPGGPEFDGKVGSPLPQTASLEFEARIRAVDQFWNLVDDSSEHVWLASDDGSITPTNPLNNGQALVSGEITMPMFLTGSGFVTLAATALDNTDLVGQQATVQVQQGANYRISAPDSARVGPPQVFTVEVSLVDENGEPMPAANNGFNIQALRSNLEPASSQPLITSAVLSAGTVTITGQAYDTVEDIVLWVTDAAGRSSYSSTIHMQPNGLEYVVAMTAEQPPLAGPPATFPLTVTLRDVDTHTVVDESRRIGVTVMSAQGVPGQGVAGTAFQRLEHGVVNFQQSYTRAENIYVTVTDSTALSGSSPVFIIRADGYKRLQIVAPGEIVEAGIPAFEATGKSGSPTVQRSGELFPVTVRAVDQYWNLADTTSTGILRLSASDNSFAIEGNPLENQVPFVNGRRTFQGYLTAEGVVAVSVNDEADPSRPSQSAAIPVDPPYQYRITVPASASTGPIPGFQVTVRLVDPVTGAVVPSGMNPFDLTPLLANHAAASGTLGITESQLVGGVCVINTQSYTTVENIIIKVSDDFGREAFSSVITMDSGGLYYSVTVPDTATVGPPSSFPLVVELLDSNTGQRVATQDRLFHLNIRSAQTGLAGTGTAGVVQGILGGGICSLAQTYTLAEDVFIEVSDDQGVVGISNVCNLAADGFKRIQLVSPGETPVPGAMTGDGKEGDPLTQQAEVPFTLTVRAVDQYWNRVHSVQDGAIQLTSEEGLLDLVDPDDAGAPLVNGARDLAVVLGHPGLVTVFAEDSGHPAVVSGRVEIPVNEAQYQVILPEPARVTAGPPTTFPVRVRLVNPESGERIDAGGAFQMTALLPDRSAAHDSLGILVGTLVAGECVIGNQYYGTSEQIVIRISDDRGRESFSEVLTIEPEDVRYAVDVPDTVAAGVPFAMSVRRVDTVTGQLVTSDDRSFSIQAFHGGFLRPDLSLAPCGVLGDSLGMTVAGERIFGSQTYDRAESINLRVSDDSGEQFLTDVIVVRPAPAAVVRVSVEIEPGQELARALRPGEAVTIRTRVTDPSGNPVPGARVDIQILEGDAGLGSSRGAAASILADHNGETATILEVDPSGVRDILLQARSGEVYSTVQVLTIMGLPLTSAAFAPEVTPFKDGYYLTPETVISLAAVTEHPDGINAIYFDVDQTDPPRPGLVYSGPFTLSDLGGDSAEPGRHILRFLAEENSGALEVARTVVLYTASDLSLDREITNRPNPFNPGEGATMILFRPRVGGIVTLTIYDLYGDVVRSEQHRVTAGEIFQLPWDGTNSKGHVVANGGYICRVHGNGLDLRRKIAVVK